MYQIEYYSSVKKDLKKLDRPVLIFLKNEIFPGIKENPYQGKLLHGEFYGLRKYVFSFKGVAYRIAYEIKQDRKVVLLILVSTRENFYKELRRRIR